MADPKKWYEKSGKDSDVILSTRVRLARNLRHFPFPVRANAKQKQEIIAKVKDAFMAGSSLMVERYQVVELEKMSKQEAVSMVERHIVSPDFIADLEGKAVILSQDESISIMINEEDHIRIQVIKEGDSLAACMDTADRIDTLLSEHLDYAFDNQLGYLTQCPTNLGTGMRVSVMLHLPGLTELGVMHRMSNNLSKLGIMVRGAYGEGSKSVGSLYQMSNQITLGLSESEASQNLHSLTEKLISQERSARDKLIQSVAMQDRIYRAAGLLKNARILSSAEMSEQLSYVRLGLSTGILKGLKLEKLDSLSVNTQPAMLLTTNRNINAQEERDRLRAEIVREACKELKEE